jgi:succinoglycan biosynthesis protein ExoL
MKISYFVHDINHPDLPRRVEMLQRGGATITMMGFRRGAARKHDESLRVFDLGRTLDGRLARRVLTVAKTLPSLDRWAGEIAGSDVILARNLEMLLVAARARRYAPKAALVYECLDIHRLMLSQGFAGRALRHMEQLLLKRSQGLIVSSPGFTREYFQKTHRLLPPSLLVENKAIVDEAVTDRDSQALPNPPWRIGWFGAIRCRRSLDALTALVRSAPGLVEVVIAGRPARTVFGDTDAAFRNISGLHFLGPYKDGEAEIAALFRSCHFAWTADFYEPGRNSDWLLPNRLYRAVLYGSIPITMSHVETGRWLAAHGAGITLAEPLEKALADTFMGMTPQRFVEARAAVQRIPSSAVVTGAEECRTLVKRLGHLAAPSTPQADGPRHR